MDPIVVKSASSVVPYAKKVMLGLPWQKHTNPLTAFCVAQLTDRRRTASALCHGDAFVAHSRATIADAFLASDLEWLLQIDDDMVVPFGNAEWYKATTGFTFPDKFMGLNALDRLMSHGKTLVGALYFGRNKGAKAVYSEAGSNPQENAYALEGPHDVVKPTRWVGTGCMLVHRKVFEDIEKKFPRLARKSTGKGGHWFTSTEASLVDQLSRLKDSIRGQALTGTEAYRLLEGLESALATSVFENPLGVGEDVSFCLRAKAAGHTPYVDLGLRCGHIGSYVY